MVVLTKSATPGDIESMHAHASVENKSLGKTVTDFDLAGSLEAPTVVSIDIKPALYVGGKNILLLTTKILLCATSESKKLWDWTSRNAVLFPIFLTETVLTDRETVVKTLLKLFAKSINKQEVENDTEELDAEEDSHYDDDNDK